MEFTLVSTVFNEAKRLDQTISDLINQTLQPTEIIITDAGSTDGTYEMLKEWSKQSPISIIILQKVRCNVAEGRNIAIKAAKHNIIASMDFGCRYDPKWLESIIEPFEDVQTKVVGGAYSINENEVQTTAAKAEYILKRGYPLRINDSNFIPSSRSIAYRKEVYDNIGGYCEWLTLAADDLIFGMLIKEKGYKIIMVDKPFASWIRHKTSKGFINEAYRYGLGNGEAQVLYSQFAKMFIIKICFILF